MKKAVYILFASLLLTAATGCEREIPPELWETQSTRAFTDSVAADSTTDSTYTLTVEIKGADPWNTLPVDFNF